MTVVLDCNIWITLAFNKDLNFISFIEEQEIIIAGCKELRDEIKDVISRAKFAKYFSPLYIEKMIAAYDMTTVPYKLHTITPVVTDKKDDYLFALSDVAKADYLVTGDKQLLAVTTYHDTKVISFAKFRQLITTP